MTYWPFRLIFLNAVDKVTGKMYLALLEPTDFTFFTSHRYKWTKA